jgi:hypothetical protein
MPHSTLVHGIASQPAAEVLPKFRRQFWRVMIIFRSLRGESRQPWVYWPMFPKTSPFPGEAMQEISTRDKVQRRESP